MGTVFHLLQRQQKSRVFIVLLVAAESAAFFAPFCATSTFREVIRCLSAFLLLPFPIQFIIVLHVTINSLLPPVTHLDGHFVHSSTLHFIFSHRPTATTIDLWNGSFSITRVSALSSIIRYSCWPI